MKFYLLVFVFTLLQIRGYGQTTVLITENNKGLPFVDVYNISEKFFTNTDANGYVTIPDSLAKEVELTLSYTGYEEVSYSIGYLRKERVVVMQKGVLLQEVVMIGRTDERTQDVINQIESVSAQNIKTTNPQTSADALGAHAGVFIQKSQMGGGSPVIRGFEANKVLLVVDGVRMNNAIYRGGHLQNAITVDAAILDRMEVIYGPGSLVYGSDALGGVIHFRSKNPILDVSGNQSISGEGYIRYSTVNDEKTGHAHINIGSKKFASLTSFTTSDFGDLKTGSVRSDSYPDFGKRPNYIAKINGRDSIIENANENLQVGTAYTQYDLVQKFLYQPKDNLRFISNLQHSTSSDVPRYDALSEMNGSTLKFAEWYYGPQTRWLASIRADYDANNAMFDKVITIAAYQRIHEDRIDRRYQSDFRDKMEEDVNVLSFTSDFKKKIKNNWEINYGLEINRNKVDSKASTLDIRTQETVGAGITRYPSGGSSTSSIAAYLLTKKKIKSLDLIAGLRYSANSLRVNYLRSDEISWPESFYEGLSSKNRALNWSVGGQYNFGKGIKVKAQIATAFRSPNIDDLAKIRINNDEISVPNLGLGPESSLTSELTLAKSFSSSYISATVFSTNLEDAIIRQEFTLPDGTSFIVDEIDTLTTVANVNANSANVWGLSVNGKYQLNDYFSMIGSVNLVKGTSTDLDGNNSPLAHIPPVYGKVGLAYKKSKHSGRLLLYFNREKPLDQYGGSEDNLENATPDGTPSWSTINFYYNYQWLPSASLSIGLENILDTHYRPFSSGVSAAGRNVSITVRVAY